MTAASTRDKPSWLAQLERGQAELDAGRSRAARESLTKAVGLRPKLTIAWKLLADIATAGGDFAGARTAGDRGVASAIGEPQLKAAAELLADGRTAEAERALGELMARRPSAEARGLLAEAALRQGRAADAEASLRRCLDDDPAFEAAERSLAGLLLAQRRFGEALAQLDGLLARDGADCRTLAMKAAALTEIGRHSEASAIAAELVGRYPDQPYMRLVLAASLRTLGRTEACVAAYLECLALDPECAEAWLGLANLKTWRFTAAQLAAMEANAADVEAQGEDQAKLWFALGKAREDAGDHDSAFESYALGNATARAGRNPDPLATSAFVRRSLATFTPAFFAARRNWGAPQADPIFIVGLPRSGSTLVEQILATHPAVEGTHELPDLPMLAASVRNYPQGVASLPRTAAAALGEDYLRRTRVYRHLGRPRFIDKTPKNFLHLGLIRLALPNARVIDVRRHPLDCGVSIFRQHFGLGFSSAFDLADIGRYYADYVALMEHFDAVAPGAVHRVIYEDLVADAEAQTRAMLAFLELPFEPACLRFYENRRPVDTPSSEQVRRPISSQSIGQWRRFEARLAPLVDALGPVLQTWRGG